MDDQVRLTGPAPGFVKFPEYKVDMDPSPRRVRVKFGGEVIADTTDALLMLESHHVPVYYFPRESVRMDMLEPTDHTSH